MSRLRVASLFCCMCLAASCPAQEISNILVRVIDVPSGKPVPNKQVLIYRFDPVHHRRISEPGMPLKEVTDADGVANFPDGSLGTNYIGSGRTFADLIKTLDLQIIYASGGVQCSSTLFSMNKILDTGMVGDNHCDKNFDASKFPGSEAEAVIFVKQRRR
jgi:hypothetical protein